MREIVCFDRLVSPLNRLLIAPPRKGSILVPWAREHVTMPLFYVQLDIMCLKLRLRVSLLERG